MCYIFFSDEDENTHTELIIPNIILIASILHAFEIDKFNPWLKQWV